MLGMKLLWGLVGDVFDCFDNFVILIGGFMVCVIFGNFLFFFFYC